MNFCTNCGHENTIQTCPLCHAEVSPQWKYCGDCGTPLTYSQPTESEIKDKESKAPEKAQMAPDEEQAKGKEANKKPRPRRKPKHYHGLVRLSINQARWLNARAALENSPPKTYLSDLVTGWFKRNPNIQPPRETHPPVEEQANPEQPYSVYEPYAEDFRLLKNKASIVRGVLSEAMNADEQSND